MKLSILDVFAIVFILILMFTMIGWLAFLPFIGCFHLVAWTYRWFTRSGLPETYIASLRRYMIGVVLYLLNVGLFVLLFEFDFINSRNDFVGIYLLIVASLFPIYYWFRIYFPSKGMNVWKPSRRNNKL